MDIRLRIELEEMLLEQETSLAEPGAAIRAKSSKAVRLLSAENGSIPAKFVQG
jgi:hypothetical protein